MNRPFLNMFRDAESYGFLPVPIPVPPMIEEAFVEANTSSWGSASKAALWEISSVTSNDWRYGGVGSRSA